MFASGMIPQEPQVDKIQLNISTIQSSVDHILNWAAHFSVISNTGELNSTTHPGQLQTSHTIKGSLLESHTPEPNRGKGEKCGWPKATLPK